MYDHKETLHTENYQHPVSQAQTNNPKEGNSPEYRAFMNGEPGKYHLLIFSHRNNQRILLLDAATYTIGRHKANSIMLESPTSSRHHAYIIRLIDQKSQTRYFRILDGDFNGKASSNGLWINGFRQSAYTLTDEDIISFGEKFSLRYHVVSNRHSPTIGIASPISYTPSCQLDHERPIHTQIAHTSSPLNQSTHPTHGYSENSSTLNTEKELARLSSFAELAPHAIIETTLNGTITYYNSLAAKQFKNIQVGGESPVVDKLFETLAQNNTQILVREITVEDCIYEQNIHCLLQSSVIRSFFTDITNRKKLEHNLHETKTRYAAAIEGSNEGIWDWDLCHNTIYFSPRWKTMIGYEEQEIGNHPNDWFSRIHPNDLERLQQELNNHYTGKKSHFDCEYQILTKANQYRWVHIRGLAIKDENNQAIRIAGSQADIHDHYIAQSQLAHNALHDGMTGLPNRTLLIDRLNQVLKTFNRNPQQQCAILFIDLDRFKLINDSLGHSAGDELLIEVSRRLKSCVRNEDTVARLGGDEFVILLQKIKADDEVKIVAKRILESLKKAVDIQGHEIFTSASIGIALGENSEQTSEELLQNADAAMYQAKRLGKSQYAIYGKEMEGQSIQILTLEGDLQRAVQKQEFQLFYQAITDLNTQAILGFEALIRWNHPTRGLVSPNDFIPIAEETGLIIPLGWWVIDTACQQINHWTQRYPHQPLYISVNISKRQFIDPNFITTIQQIIKQHLIPQNTLKLEITEGVAMQNPQEVAKKLAQLQALGLHLMMDDFGTGYSSLASLQTFSINTLKIDRSFINSMFQDNGIEIVKTIIQMAHNLKMNVIAEGVEHREQAEHLHKLGCEYAQGYYFSKPLDVETIEQSLLKNTVLKIA